MLYKIKFIVEIRKLKKFRISSMKVSKIRVNATHYVKDFLNLISFNFFGILDIAGVPGIGKTASV